MSFKPLPCAGRWLGIVAMLALLAGSVLSVRQLLVGPINGISFILGAVALGCLLSSAYIGYRTVCALTLEYWVDRDAVTLIWGASRQIVPLTQIRSILDGASVSAVKRPRPWHWPCPFRRRIVGEGIGVVNAYATRPLEEQLILVTANESYGLSPASRGGFLGALQERYALGAVRPLDAELRRPPLWTWPLWRDRVALFLVGFGLLGVLVMFAALSFRFPYLSEDLPLHFGIDGLPDRIEPKSGLFALPLIGLMAWFFDTSVGVWLYRHLQREAAYLLWGSAFVVQGIAGLALFNLMRW